MPPPVDDDDLAKVRHLTNFTAMEAAALCSAVEIVGACAPLVGEAPKPALMFRFTHVDGTELAPIVLVIGEHLLEPLANLVAMQCQTAAAKTRNIRSLS